MKFLVYCGVTAGTGQQLAERLGIRSGEEIPNERLTHLIRWGSMVSSPYTPLHVLNSATALAANADKLAAFRTMRAAGVRVPNFLRLSEMTDLNLNEVKQKGLALPVLARKSHHTRGRDILLCLQNKDLVRAVRWGKEFLVEYIPTAYEYRVHVFGDEIIKVSQKILHSREDYIPYLRNDDHNHTFRNPRRKLKTEDKSVCIAAVHSLGLNFAAVDMVVGDNGSPYVLEANTGPSLIDSSMEAYERKFRDFLGRE